MYDQLGNKYLDCINNVAHGTSDPVDVRSFDAMTSTCSGSLSSARGHADLQTDGRVRHEQPVSARQHGDSRGETSENVT